MMKNPRFVPFLSSVGAAREMLIKERLFIAALFAGLLLPLGIFGKFADTVRDGEMWRFDAPLLHLIHRHSTTGRDPLVLFITNSGRFYIIVPLVIGVIAWLMVSRRFHQARFFSAAIVGAGLLNVGAKLFFGRARPDLWVSIAPEPDYSFPSGHAMITMAIASALIVLAWPTRGRWPTLLIGASWVLAVGFTRLYLGVHYPSDVLGGWCASVFWVTGVHFIHSLFLRRAIEQPR